jgi:hypothetical protein
MWKDLMDLFQNSNDHRKLVLKDELRKIKMEKGDYIQNISRTLSNVGMSRGVWE